MSIQWNKEISVTDVAKFFNQEIDMKPVEKLFTTEIDLNKCAQVAAMVAIFGVIPAFTYGTVLGTLEGQRVALLTDVTSLQAEVLMSAKSIVSASSAGTSTIISNVRTDKEVYAQGSTTLVSYSSATSTGTVRISLYDSKSNLIKDFGTTTSKLGINTFSLVVPSSSADLFTVRVTHLQSNRTATSNKFEIKKIAVVSPNGGALNRVIIKSSPESYIGQGKNIDLRDAVSYYFPYENPNIINFSFTDGSWVQFAAPSRGPLLPGVYNEVMRSPFNGDKPGLAYITPGRANNNLSGSFVIHELEYANRKVIKAAIDFVQYDEGNLSMKTEGKIRYNSSIPMDVKVTSNPIAVTLQRASSVLLPGDASVGSSDIGVFRFSVKVTAGAVDMYVPNSQELRGFVAAHTGKVIEGGHPMDIFTKRNEKDTDNAFFIPKGTTRVFDIVVTVDPAKTGDFGIGLFGMSWGDSLANFQKNVYKIIPEFKSSSVYLNAR